MAAQSCSSADIGGAVCNLDSIKIDLQEPAPLELASEADWPNSGSVELRGLLWSTGIRCERRSTFASALCQKVAEL